jgi:hypothetical protein
LRIETCVTVSSAAARGSELGLPLSEELSSPGALANPNAATTAQAAPNAIEIPFIITHNVGAGTLSRARGRERITGEGRRPQSGGGLDPATPRDA